MINHQQYLSLAEVAETQWGLITTGQAHAVDIDADLLEQASGVGLLTLIDDGVYRLAGVPDSPHHLLQAAWLRLDPTRSATARLTAAEVPDAVISHRSAAAIHGLGDLDLTPVEVTANQPIATTGVLLHSGEISRREWQPVAGLPVTTPARTVADLAATRIDGGHLATIVRDALFGSSATTTAAMARALDPAARFYSCPSGEQLLQVCLEQAGIPEACAVLTADIPTPSAN
ncbi:type IV toxin-antitoxin system AbiEi family antitoxin domain-containing protein (plasmid) [Nocardia sp. CA-084685]|uniref:type IV toxin-antitoxin system AbiEi family antitoxin domain-containing protein n=1 Tax=Nocardia sp. CA-084685 TaxID=3239970 RepID=UPI003D95CBAF